MSKNAGNPRKKTPQLRTPRSASTRKTARRKLAEQQVTNSHVLALEARQRRNRRLGIGSIAIVIVIVATLIVAKLAGGTDSSGGGFVTSPPAGTPIPTAITDKLTSVALKTLNAAPTGGLIASPQGITDPALKVDGKPDLLFVGAEFCPICASERWAMYVALSEFGTFAPQPGRIHSAVRDGDIPTVTFYRTTFSSPYFTFTPEETTTNQPDGDYYVALQKLNSAQKRLWDSHTDGFPWLDFGGKMDLTSVQYNPEELEGASFDTITSEIGNNSTVIGADIDASARVLVHTICSTMTGGQPARVCRAVR
jgi:Domain of unknown function (DUF929)